MYKLFLSILFASILLAACSDSSSKIEEMQNKIDALQSKVDNLYKPGFGELMSNVQVHHAKLWFAGINQNWKLAEFEIHEIEESIEDIKKFQSEREETKSLNVISEPLENLKPTIESKNLESFKSGFNNLTATCNSCHQAVKFEFNKVVIPTTPPYSNQEFK